MAESRGPLTPMKPSWFVEENLFPRSENVAPEDDVALPTEQYLEDRQTRKLCRNLMGGTAHMQSLTTEYLPIEEGEAEADYTRRLERGYLFNGMRRAVKTLSGKPFTKPIRRSNEMSDPMREFLENVDLQGNRLEVFGRSLLEEAMVDGIAFIRVDFPMLQDEDGRQKTEVPLSEVETRGLRPYWQIVTADQVLGWRISEDGELIQARIYSCSQEPVGMFGVVSVHRILVLEPGIFHRYKYDLETRNWIGDGFGASGPADKIPLVPIAFGSLDPMRGVPPLRDLADINLAHYRSTCDQRNILHIARVPILFGRGINDDGENVGISPNTALMVKEPSADLSWVETQGNSIAAGKDDLADLQEQMAESALELLVPRTGNFTATAASLGVADSVSEMQANALALTDGLNRAIALTSEMMPRSTGSSVPEAGYVDVHTDFAFSFRDIQEMQLIMEVRKNEDLSRKYLIAALDKKNLFGMEFDAEDNERELEAEAKKQMAEMLAITASEAKINEKEEDGSAPPKKPKNRESVDSTEETKRVGGATN